MVGDVLDLGRAAGENRRGRETGCGLRADRGGRAACRGNGSATRRGATGNGCAANGGGAAGRGCTGSGRSCAGGSGTSGACTGTRGACTGTAAPAPAPAPAAAPPPRACTRGRAAAATAEEPAELGDQRALEEEQRPGREDRGEGLGVGTKLGAELAAGVARLQMAPDRAGDLGDALGGLGQLQANVVAGELARLAGLGQGDAGPNQQALHARHGRVHRLGDLLVAHRVDLTQQQRGALGLRAAGRRRRAGCGTPRGSGPARAWSPRSCGRGCPSCPGRRRSACEGG